MSSRRSLGRPTLGPSDLVGVGHIWPRRAAQVEPEVALESEDIGALFSGDLFQFCLFAPKPVAVIALVGRVDLLCGPIRARPRPLLGGQCSCISSSSSSSPPPVSAAKRSLVRRGPNSACSTFVSLSRRPLGRLPSKLEEGKKHSSSGLSSRRRRRRRRRPLRRAQVHC